jgi:hypothetical protein
MERTQIFLQEDQKIGRSGAQQRSGICVAFYGFVALDAGAVAAQRPTRSPSDLLIFL